MRKINIGRKVVEIYDSIDELPVKRFHKFNKYMLVDSGVGSDLNTINDHIGRISKYMEKDPPSARRELENLRQSLYMVIEEINIKHLSFALLVKSINGKEVHDLSEENVKRISAELSNIELGVFDRLIESVKKKIDQELSLYFPSQFDNVAVKEYYDRIQSRTLLQLDTLIREKDNAKQIETINDFLLEFAKPQIFSGKDSAEIKYDKDFEEMCLFLKKELSIDIDNTTVMQFYTSFGYIKKLRKNARRNNKL
jgi:hypothetical protein